MTSRQSSSTGLRLAPSGLRLPPISLRTRIAFYYTFMTALLMAAVFAAILFSIDKIVYLHFDEELRHEVEEALEEARMNERILNGLDGFRDLGRTVAEYRELEEIANQRDVHAQFIQLVDSEGRVLSKSFNLAGNSLSFNAASSGVRYFDSTVGGVMVRQVQVPLVSQMGDVQAYLIIGIPTRSTMRVLQDLRNILLWSLPAIILLLFILARALAGSSIRPVGEVIATAESMTQANLHQRIPLPEKHDELYRLSVTINALLSRLEDAFAREKHFTSDAAHELKTPIAVVKGTLDVLVRKPRPVAQYEEKIHYCLDELNRMARLIDQLFMLARYEQKSVKPQIVPIEFSTVLEPVISRLEHLAGDKQLSFVRQNIEQSMVSADPAMLEMILENILSNAIKFSPAGSSIDIEVTRSPGQVICTITDHGIGIPEEHVQYVFDRFYRVDESRSSGTGGFGLGLSIVRRLADLQNIAVSLSSREHAGTAFRLVFQAI